MAADELTPHEENSLLRIADGADAQNDVEEAAAVSRLQSLSLVEQRGMSFGPVAPLSRSAGYAPAGGDVSRKTRP